MRRSGGFLVLIGFRRGDGAEDTIDVGVELEVGCSSFSISNDLVEVSVELTSTSIKESLCTDNVSSLSVLSVSLFVSSLYLLRNWSW